MEGYKTERPSWLPEQTAWDNLPMEKKAEIIRICMNQGIHDLQDIRTAYNRHVEGKDIFGEEGIEHPSISRARAEGFGRFLAIGGKLEHKYDGTSEDSQQMEVARPNIFKRPNGTYFYQDPEGQEVSVAPIMTTLGDESMWTYQDESGRRYTPRYGNNEGTITQVEIPSIWDKVIAASNNNYMDPVLGAPARWKASWDNNTNAIRALWDNPAITGHPLGMAAKSAEYLLSEEGLKKTKRLYDNWDGSDNSTYYLTRSLVGDALTGLGLIPVSAQGYKASKYAANELKSMVNTYAAEHPGLYQYPRYAIGKLKYGFDAELPTLYRKIKGLPTVENGEIQISNPNNRFAFDNGYGEESPLLTNFTTDAPVRSHNAGDWDRGLTLAFPGKTLLGKKVVSTRPSDTFVYGENISIPIKDVKAFTGRQKEINFLNDKGIEYTTSPDAQIYFESGVEDYLTKAAKYRADRQKILNAKTNGENLVLLRPKRPIDNFSNYAREIEDMTRAAYKAPTAKDYAFMDYVFKPQYTSQTMPVLEDITIDAANKYPLLGEWAGDVERLRYLGDFSRWKNVMYDPLTPVEADFRRSLNIGLKPEFKK